MSGANFLHQLGACDPGDFDTMTINIMDIMDIMDCFVRHDHFWQILAILRSKRHRFILT